jgi:hypothetical protein
MVERWSYKWLVVLLLLLVAALGVLAMGRHSVQAVQSAPPQSVMASFSCTPFDVGVFIARVHVRCTTSVNVNGNIVWWWAYPTSDSAGASRFLSLFETAKATATNVTIYYDPNDLTGNTFGCGNADCRRIWGATSP